MQLLLNIGLSIGLKRAKIHSLLQVLQNSESDYDQNAVQEAGEQLCGMLGNDNNNKRRFLEDRLAGVVLHKWPQQFVIDILQLLCKHEPSCGKLVNDPKFDLLKHLADFVERDVAVDEARQCAAFLRDHALKHDRHLLQALDSLLGDQDCGKSNQLELSQVDHPEQAVYPPPPPVEQPEVPGEPVSTLPPPTKLVKSSPSSQTMAPRSFEDHKGSYSEPPTLTDRHVCLPPSLERRKVSAKSVNTPFADALSDGNPSVINNQQESFSPQEISVEMPTNQPPPTKSVESSPSQTSQSPKEEIKPLEEWYTINCGLFCSGRNTLFEGCRGYFGDSNIRIIKVYPPNALSRATNERDNLDRLWQFEDEAKEYVVMVDRFHKQIDFNQKICAAIAMEKGQQNLQQLVQTATPGEISRVKDSTMRKISECLLFVHSRAIVHGDVRLRNVVDFRHMVSNWKMVGFETSCIMGGSMWIDYDAIDAQYCPPEVASELVVKRGSCWIPASPLFDVYGFGVLWMKYLNEDVIVEFIDTIEKHQILFHIARTDFNFEKTLQQLPVSQPTKRLIRRCTHRDPRLRPSFKEIRKDPVINGYNTELMLVDSENKQMVQAVFAMKKHIATLHNTIVAMRQVGKHVLPCLWALVPWQKANQDEQKHMPWTWQWKQDFELKMVCEAAFDDPSGNAGSACSSCHENHRIHVKNKPAVVEKVLRVLRCSIAVFNIANLACRLVGTSFPEELQHMRVLDVLEHEVSEDEQALNKILHSVDAVNSAQTASPIKQEKDMKTVMSVLDDQKQTIFDLYQSPEKQQMMLEILHLVDSTRVWTNEKIIGGLEMIIDRLGHVRWVCENHARELGGYHTQAIRVSA